MEHVLVGDVGGTSARFAVASRGPEGRPILDKFHKFQNDDFDSLSSSLRHFVSVSGAQADAALMAVAGPVDARGSVTLSNRAWPRIRPDELQVALGLSKVKIVNDFAAMSRAIPEMSEADFVDVLPGRGDPASPLLITGPGTGFGVGTLIPLPNGGYHVLTGEGGNATFSAHTLREAQLAEKLKSIHGYVSTEMVVGGIWLQPVFDALSDLHGVPRRELSPAEIMDAADANDPVCREVCELRARAIMGAAGDGVLMMGARGGVVLSGGVAERMVKWLKAPDAVARFYDRGSRASYMEEVPVRVVTSPEAPLIGGAALMFDGTT